MIDKSWHGNEGDGWWVTHRQRCVSPLLSENRKGYLVLHFKGLQGLMGILWQYRLNGGGAGGGIPISHIPLIHMPVVISFYSIQLLENLFLPLDQITLFFKNVCQSSAT